MNTGKPPVTAIQPVNAGQSPIGTGQLAIWVRNWVHYDNLATNFTKQSGQSRKLRDDFELKIIDTLKQQKMETAQIQITGAKLQLVQEKSFPSLTIGRLEDYLHQYFKKKGVMMDETEQIMRFIREQKQTNFQLDTRLRKTPTTPFIPPPPPPPPV
jgi:hypothetical protein